MELLGQKIDWNIVCKYFWPFVKAVLIFVVGHYIIKGFIKISKYALNKTKLDKSLINILIKSLMFIGNFFVFMASLTTLGVSTVGLLASFSAVAVSLALALKDSLSNIAGGIILLAAPRFNTGDYIAVAGEEGFVDEINLLHTTIRTYDNRHISLSNGVILNNTITNYTWEGKHRLDLVFPIPYSADVEFVKSLVNSVVSRHSLILPVQQGERIIRIGDYAESAVMLHVFVWVKRENYITVRYDLLEQIRAELLKNDIVIPFNQLDVHLDNVE